METGQNEAAKKARRVEWDGNREKIDMPLYNLLQNCVAVSHLARFILRPFGPGF